MLKTRVITAIVLLAVFLPVTLFAPVGAFGALIAFVVVFAAWEWARLLKLGGAGPVIYALVAAVALVASTRLGIGVDSAQPFYKAAAIFWVIAGPFVLLRKPTLAQGAWRSFLLLVGIVIFVACWHALVAARMQGVPFVLSLLLLVWLADIGAYFSGKAFGKHKLAPAISPGKTWEGAIGGWLAVMIVAVAAVLSHAFEPTLYSELWAHWGAPRALLALTLLVAFSVVGDLFESMMKRQAGVKDSSGLLPGHGGVLDRIDALLPVLPLAMLLLG
ncbi:phosphatidate cytidylyltransferase [Paraburkholderia sp. GV068]|jgi:phosphatidate cytidylyltransferase|uniref:phosphatidate cytidylyltransferase n=1 Tax=Paraburkholderia TaxID=1822464 RepID=UPI000D309471|nr:MULTISPECIES: phosphatidate cytidylyltransferase [Paraburkholderia]AXF08260.1 phosphatidate cytidylyltransferase [Paraburkholderia graminis]MDR6467083.1 phosphatidate cytidylyltransferase [Paraburkholderia graminis]MDR6473631.1 phosphatidate cytidylyltransferase [Paraburkholderia graminis]PTR04277.1 phosphatidate cytidylyltransferase [Paraburkholderia sp. GV072]PUB09234.1 phosphatidate cytidylyltransferase [Paraburkholderia sp. GV068]